MKKLLLLSILIVISFSAFPQEENLALFAEGKYFSLHGYSGLDTNFLLKKLDYGYFGHIDSILGEENLGVKSSLANTIDGLFMEVSDILDIHIYSFHGKIKIVPDKSYINSIFQAYFRQNFSERSFYLPEKNTIYISFSDLTVGMLGHEIAHAIISRYFVVSPPAKVQEVLAGYVEYKLQKKTGR